MDAFSPGLTQMSFPCQKSTSTALPTKATATARITPRVNILYGRDVVDVGTGVVDAGEDLLKFFFRAMGYAICLQGRTVI